MSTETPKIADEELPTEFGEAIDGLALGMFSIDQVRASLALILQKNSDGVPLIQALLDESVRDGRLSDADHKTLSTDIEGLVSEDAPTEWSRGVGNFLDSQRESALKSIGTSQDIAAPIQTESRSNRAPDAAAGVPEKLVPGAVLRNRFKLESHIEAGSMGEIFKAIDFRKLEAGSMDAAVAIKVISEKFSRFPNALKALQQEAANGQRLSHPNIVRVFDFDRFGNHFYMTMEWLDGESLVNILNTHRFRPLPFDKGKAIFDGVCNGLIYAHQQGVIHADIKPGNIFVTTQGEVKLLDFGIARAGHTAPGGFDPAVIGAHTPAYSSCEVLEGKPPTQQDDVYSLACIAYRMFAGRRAFSGFTALESESHDREPKPIETLSSGQWRALRRAMAYRREDRTPDVATFLDEFSKAPRAESTLHEGDEYGMDAFDEGGSRMPWIFGGVATVAIAGIIAVSLWPRSETGEATRPAAAVVQPPESIIDQNAALAPWATTDSLIVEGDEGSLDLLGDGDATLSGELTISPPVETAASTPEDFARLARQRMDEGFLVEPREDSAMHYLSMARGENPDSPAFQPVANRLANLMMLEAMIAITDKDFALADKWLVRAKSLDAEQDATMRVTRELAKARNAETKRESEAFGTVFASTTPAGVSGGAGDAPDLPAEQPPASPAGSTAQLEAPQPRPTAPAVVEIPAEIPAEIPLEPAAAEPVVNDAAPAAAIIADNGTPGGEIAALPQSGIQVFADNDPGAPSLNPAPVDATVEDALAARVIDAPTEPAAPEFTEIPLSDLEFTRFVEPRYPRRTAATRDAGWVEVSFRVNEKGAVDNIEVVDSEPRGLFENAATRAVGRWRFKPLVVDGAPTASYSGVRLRFDAGP